MSFEAGGLDRILTSKPLVWLGARSYAIYMTHATILLPTAALGKRIGDHWHTGLAVLYLLLVLLVADYLHRKIELPWRSWFRRL